MVAFGPSRVVRACACPAAVAPGGEVGGNEIGDALVVPAEVVAVEQGGPLTTSAPVEEVAVAAPDAVAGVRNQVIGALFHAVEGGSGRELLQTRVGHRNLEGVAEALQLAGQVRQKVAVVEQRDVVLASQVPEGRQVVQDRGKSGPHGRTVVVVVHPGPEALGRVGGRGRGRRPEVSQVVQPDRGGARRHEGSHVQVGQVVLERQGDVTGVTSHAEIGHPVVVG